MRKLGWWRMDWNSRARSSVGGSDGADGGQAGGDLGGEGGAGERADAGLVPGFGDDFADPFAGGNFEALAEAQDGRAGGGKAGEGFADLLDGKGEEDVVGTLIGPGGIVVRDKDDLMAELGGEFADGGAPGAVAEYGDVHDAGGGEGLAPRLDSVPARRRWILER